MDLLHICQRAEGTWIGRWMGRQVGGLLETPQDRLMVSNTSPLTGTADLLDQFLCHGPVEQIFFKLNRG